jgi:K+-transporting ATPase ATPase C chain
MKEIKNAILILLVFTILLGIIYPLLITGISQVAFPYQANGNLIKENGKILGSELIGQDFSSPSYFHSRPSVINYNSSTSSGSNLGPTNQKLADEVKKRIEHVQTENSLPSSTKIPADLVLASGSGLDGYISVDSAMIQVPRIAKARRISESEIVNLIETYQENTFFGFGEEVVNVLKLNIALDSIKK